MTYILPKLVKPVFWSAILGIISANTNPYVVTSQQPADMVDIDFDEHSDPDYDPDIYTDPDADYDPRYDGVYSEHDHNDPNSDYNYEREIEVQASRPRTKIQHTSHVE